MENKYPPFPNSYWVIPEKFLAGEYPGTPDPEGTRKKLLRLISSGITFCLDLTEFTDVRLPYFPILQDLANEMKKDIQYTRIAIHDFSIPSPDVMKGALDTIDYFLEKNWTVYVHCQGGIGRTGTVVGCYLVRHGMDGIQAIEYIAGLRKDTADWWYPSPEAPKQVDMIKNWKIGA